MMRVVSAFLLALVAFQPTAIGEVTHQMTAKTTPITRITKLLHQLSADIDKQAKEEEDLYWKFICWARTVIAAKMESNAKAKARKEELENYIADINGGKVEFTSERADLEKQIKELREDLSTAKKTREEQHSDFLQAETEMSRAVNALQKAKDVLFAATTGRKKLALTEMRTESMEERSSEAGELHLAAQIAQRELSKGDALFLHELLTGDVPVKKVDKKYADKKADFKQKYQARSVKIQKTVEKMLEIFTRDLGRARDTEQKAQADYDNLFKLKSEQLDTAETAYASMSGETAKRDKVRSESQAEVDALAEQIDLDNDNIGQVQWEVSQKTTDLGVRQHAQKDEQQAFANVIAMLTENEGATALSKKFRQRSFLQEGMTNKISSSQRAASMLNAVAHESQDVRLVRLARTMIALGNEKFKEVFAAIDAMRATLSKEMEQDLEIVNKCNNDRSTDGWQAIKTSRQVDAESDNVNRMRHEIAELNNEINTNKNTIKESTDSINRARAIREEDHAEFVKLDNEDQAAYKVIDDTFAYLKKFYKEQNWMALLQEDCESYETADTCPTNDSSFGGCAWNGAKCVAVSKDGTYKTADGTKMVSRRGSGEIAAGEAPPPPPQTWDTYTGKTEESKGIMEFAEVIKDDIDKDRQIAKEEEAAAQAVFDKALANYKTEKEKLEIANSRLSEQLANTEADLNDEKQNRKNSKTDLDSQIEQMEAAAGECDFYTLNFETRKRSRTAELDALKTAKAILNGADMTSTEAPPLAPGAGFLQRK